jgi:hypothetical protein
MGPMIPTVVLSREFYFNLSHFCDKVNIFNLFIIKGKVFSTRSQTKQLQFPSTWIGSKNIHLCVNSWHVFTIDQYV